MNIHDIERLGRELSVRSYLATVGAAGEPHVVPVHRDGKTHRSAS